MRLRLEIFSLCTLMLFFSLPGNSITHAQETKKLSEIPVTTSSDEARMKYMEGLNQLENLYNSKAAALFDEAIKMDPDFALAYMGKALSVGGFKQSMELMDKAASKMDKVSEGEKHLIAFNKAQLENNNPKMNQELKTLLAKFPSDKRVHMMAANNEYFNNRYDAALKHLEKSIELDRNFSPAYNMLGYTYSQMGNLPMAEEAFRKYISLTPQNPNPYDSYGELLLKFGKYDESIAQYQKALDLAPDFVTSMAGIGNNYAFKGDMEKARKYYQMEADKATDISQKLGAMSLMASTFVKENKIDQAIKVLEQRRELAEKENQDAAVYSSLAMKGFIYAENGKFTEAGESFKKAAESAKKSSTLPKEYKENLMMQAKLNNNYLMISQGKLDEASKELKSLKSDIEKSQDPGSMRTYNMNMGLLSLKQNKADEALQHFSKVNQAGPMLWYYQSLAYQKKGDNSMADKLKAKIKNSNEMSLDLALAASHLNAVAAEK